MNMITNVQKLKVSVDTQNACEWKYNRYDDIQLSSCNNIFYFEEGGPTENGFNFCPFCGKSLVEIIDE